MLLLGVWIAGHTPDQQANAAATPPAEPKPETPAGNLPPPSPPPALPEIRTISAPVRQGDNLALIFKRHGLAARDLQLVLDSGPLGKRLRDIFPGHEFEFRRDADGNLVHLDYRPGRLETVTFQRLGDRFQGSTVMTKPHKVTAYKHAVIEHSLFAACQRQGLDDGFAKNLAEIFQWDIDFILDVRAGDEFHVLYDELYLDGQFYAYGTIRAAEFINQGDSYRAVFYQDGSGTGSHYSPDGKSMRKAFLRAPLDYSRVSSNFNLKRIHPLWKSAMPHRGIDYAAPRGTRVKAAGQGTVIEASKNAANGNYIVIQHGQRYQTKYLHLSSFARNLRKGTRVSQGQTIGNVGATGWATGPHLHYEFLVDGVHRDPSKIAQLPAAEPVQIAERPAFEAATVPLLQKLERHKTGGTLRQLAHQNTTP